MEFDELCQDFKISKGTYETGKQALKQGKPLFVAVIPEDTNFINKEINKNTEKEQARMYKNLVGLKVKAVVKNGTEGVKVYRGIFKGTEGDVHLVIEGDYGTQYLHKDSVERMSIDKLDIDLTTPLGKTTGGTD